MAAKERSRLLSSLFLLQYHPPARLLPQRLCPDSASMHARVPDHLQDVQAGQGAGSCAAGEGFVLLQRQPPTYADR